MTGQTVSQKWFSDSLWGSDEDYRCSYTSALCVDDGAHDSEMSLALMSMDYEQGVRGIFCTSHSYGMKMFIKIITEGWRS